MLKQLNNGLCEVISSVQDIRNKVKFLKSQGKTVGFVPTMGALHAGHESLIKQAKQKCDAVIVSVFVNPVQFGPNEDYAKYPRKLEDDRLICSNIGVDVVFSPEVAEMYGDSDILAKDLTLVVPPRSLSGKLCGISRQGHFEGVATVVQKLFNIVQPDFAFFGQKDAQQVVVIKKMVKDLSIPVEIVSCPIVRDIDGLALSSRNTYLTTESRKIALSLSEALNKFLEIYNSGQNCSEKVLNKAKECLHKDVELEYFSVMDFDTLEPISEIKNNSLIAMAAKVNGIRLIDNIVIK